MNPRSKVFGGARDIAICAAMAALLEVSKLSLSWLANVELVSFLILLFACCFGWRALPATVAFVGLEILVWGFGLWTISYLYLWPLLALIGLLLRKMHPALGWALVSGVFGLIFGALCAIPYLFIGGWQFAFSWWIAGIPFDLVHGGANFIIALILWKPLHKLLQPLQRKLFQK